LEFFQERINAINYLLCFMKEDIYTYNVNADGMGILVNFLTEKRENVNFVHIGGRHMVDIQPLKQNEGLS
jgi:hypothetical protein